MLKGQKCLVVGCGKSGISAVNLLNQLGAEVIWYDSNEKLTPKELEEKLPSQCKAKCFIGEISEEEMDSIEKVVLSPGVPLEIPLVKELKKRNIPIWGEIELGYLAERGRVIAITGTNGKTTTTTLIGDIMKSYFGTDKVFVVGNIGNPYTAEVLKTASDTITVAEISSFQLETIHTFRPVISAILNITPDHLNRHHTMEEYVRVKEMIASNQQMQNQCILNYDNEYTREFAKRCPAFVQFFSSKEELENGFFLKGDKICKAQKGCVTELLDIYKDMNLVGICNVENVMAAIAVAEGMGVPLSVILEVIRNFHAVEHRIEFVASKKEVDYYNDSKGTNPDAAIQGIRAMRKPTILIGGGYDKQSEYDEWIENFEDKVKYLILIGQTKEKIAACAKKHGFPEKAIYLLDSFEECLKLCSKLAKPGDAVLLSPACASWGMFPNYEVRGKIFKDYVNSLEE